MSSFMLVRCACPCCGQRRGLAHLIDLYERNYRLLERLVPELDLPFESAVSRAGDEPVLGLEVVHRSRYTSELCLHYCFEEQGPELRPDVRIRICRDAGTAEVLGAPPERCWPLAVDSTHNAEQFLREQWQRNHFLLRWLEYLLDHGHGFSLAGRPRVAHADAS